MTCPKCGREMQEILSEGVPIDFCTGCRGTFLDKGEEPGFAGQPDALAKALKKGLHDALPSDFDCPRCGGRMRQGWILAREFVLDRCDGCSGLWFDSRELSRLKKLQPEPEVPVAPSRPAREVTVIDERAGGERGAGSPPGGRTADQGRIDPTRPSARAAPSGMICPSCKQPPRETDQWQCRCGFQWHAIGTAGVCPRCRRRWEELQCLRCAAWNPPAKWLRR